MEEDDLVGIRDFKDLGEGRFGVCEDFGGERGAVRDFGEGEAGVFVVEEGAGAGFEDKGWEGCGAGAEVGDVFSVWHDGTFGQSTGVKSKIVGCGVEVRVNREAQDRLTRILVSLQGDQNRAAYAS